MSNSIIITGASGFIGRHIVSLLLKDEADIHVITRNKATIERFDWIDQVTIIEHNINDPEINFHLPANSSLVHLAWEGLPNYKDAFHVERNLPNSFHFIKSLVQKGVKKALVTGTCFEYGMKNGPINANTPPDPQNSYSLAKDRLRQFLIDLQDEHPFDLQWARLFYMYGAGQNPKSILAQLDAAIDNGDDVFNMSGGEQLRDYLPIEDVADQLYTLFKSDGQGCFNICSGEPISIRRLVENHIHKRGANIALNLGYYPYPDYEPMEFWGVKD